MRHRCTSCRQALSPDLRDELARLAPPFSSDTPSEAELRVAKAQLVGWLEGLFHGIQATLFAQQMAARQQLEQIRGQLPPGPGRSRPQGPSAPAPTSEQSCYGANHTRVSRSRARRRDEKGKALGDSFVHLHLHTEFSMLDGAARVDDVIEAAVADEQPAVGITDHGNMYGVLDFYKACRERGVKPIIGMEAYMAGESRFERPPRRGRMDDSGGETEGGKKLYYHLTLLAENQTGYKNLIKLASLAFLEGYYYQPRVDWELLDRHHEGLIATTGCLGGHVLQSMLAGDGDGALSSAARLRDIFGPDHLFVELQDHGIPAQRQTMGGLLDIATKLGSPVLATNDSHYVHRDDSMAHDALLCVQTGTTIDDPKRFKFEGDEHYLKTANEMRSLFRERPDACDNTLWVAERADVQIEFGKPQLPAFPIPEGFADDADYLRHLAMEGAHQRWGEHLHPDDRRAHRLRAPGHLRHGLRGLLPHRAGTSSATPASTASGSVPGGAAPAGCAVAYCLRITDLDPIKYDLLFERFLNPGRIQMPDIDMDFDDRYRDEMIRYASERYGRDHVAQIVTFSKIKARAAVRDAARVLGYPYAVGDKVAKAMPPLMMGRDTPLHACFELDPKHEDGFKAAAELREMYAADPDVKKVVDVARGLEGLRRQAGIHASAVVITRDELTEYLPLQRRPENGQDARRRADRHAVRDARRRRPRPAQDGLPRAAEPVGHRRDRRAHPRAHRRAIDMDNLPARRRRDVRDVAARRLDRRVPARRRPDALAHACARADVLRRRRGAHRAVPARADGGEHAHRLRGPQERPSSDQLRPSRHGGGARRHLRPDDLPRVDDARRPALRWLLAHRCRQPPQGMRQEDPRADGASSARSSWPACVETGYGDKVGTQLFDLIEPFADYAFGKSHSYGYGLVAYQTAWLKAHHPVEYLAALLTSVKASQDKAAVYLAECRQMGIKVLVPDVNVSSLDFTALAVEEAPTGTTVSPGTIGLIPFGLSAVRNVGESLVRQILDEREKNGSVRRLLRLLRASRPVGAEQAGDRVLDQGGRVRLTRPPSPRAAVGVRADRRHHTRPPPRARPRRHEPVRRGRLGCRGLLREGRDPRPRVRQDPAPQVREGDARPLCE